MFDYLSSFFLKDMKLTAAPVSASAIIGRALKSSPVLGESDLPAGAELDDFEELDDFDVLVDDEDVFAVVVVEVSPEP